MNLGSSNVVSFLKQSAKRTPDRPALVARDDVITFSELWLRVDRVSAGLLRAGLGAGDRAIVMIPMSIHLYVILLGLLKIGAVAVFVDPWMKARQVAAFAGFAQPRAYIGIPKSHLLRLMNRTLRNLPVSITTGATCCRLPARWSISRLEQTHGDGRIFEARPEDPALITFTSGSSGTPKGANRTHGLLAAQHLALQVEFPCREEDVDLSMFPVFCLNNLASGITSVIPDMDFRNVAKVDAEALIGQMVRAGVTTAVGSPPLFDRLCRAGAPALRRILTGGAPVSDDQLVTWGQRWPDTELLVVYGSTEAEPVAHIAAADRVAVQASAPSLAPGFCMGTPGHQVTTRLIRIHHGPVRLGDAGWAEWDVNDGEVGELVVTGEHVCKDYYRNPDSVAANKIVDTDGEIWHRMGDTGYNDSDGRFWLTGRVHSTIHRDGVAVQPQCVEQAARGDDGRIRRVAAVGTADHRVLVVVESDAGAAVRTDVENRLTAAKQPFDTILVTSTPLPVDPRHNSKIDYARVREMIVRTETGTPVGS